MTRAAGILFVTPEGKALFLKRGPGSDYPGHWCVPGGRLEDGEDSVTAAIRETLEEAGRKVKAGDLVQWTRTLTPGLQQPQPALDTQGDFTTPVPAEEVEFTTYLCRVKEEFTPTLGPEGSPEHVGYAWAPITAAPEPLHPGVAISLQRFTMNELDLARAIRDGVLTSPQHYENVWLFAIRITGTGMAYRTGLQEVAVRDPADYLNEDFLERCQGLPVILHHPKNIILDSKEYEDRNVGSIMLPYIKGNEVWGIAKVMDEATAKMMLSMPLSTSPAVAWRDANTEVEINGTKYLIEGKPSLLDHVAICPQGVWDKGGDPTGVSASRGDEPMSTETVSKTEFEKWKEENAATLAGVTKALEGFGGVLKSVGDAVGVLKARADAQDEEEKDKKRADARGRADNFKFSERADGESDEDFKARRDAEEKACADAEEEAGTDKEEAKKKAADRRKDADEEDERARADAEDEKKRADRARADSVTGKTLEELQREVALLKVGQPINRTDADLGMIARVQARADEIYQALGAGRARGILPGETLLSYRRFFLNELKPHSPTYKDKDLTAVAADEALFGVIEDAALKEALATARSPASIKPGELRQRVVRADSGHTIYEYEGSASAWMNTFAGPVRQAVKAFIQPQR